MGTQHYFSERVTHRGVGGGPHLRTPEETHLRIDEGDPLENQRGVHPFKRGGFNTGGVNIEGRYIILLTAWGGDYYHRRNAWNNNRGETIEVQQYAKQIEICGEKSATGGNHPDE